LQEGFWGKKKDWWWRQSVPERMDKFLFLCGNKWQTSMPCLWQPCSSKEKMKFGASPWLLPWLSEKVNRAGRAA